MNLKRYCMDLSILMTKSAASFTALSMICFKKYTNDLKGNQQTLYVSNLTMDESSMEYNIDHLLCQSLLCIQQLLFSKVHVSQCPYTCTTSMSRCCIHEQTINWFTIMVQYACCQVVDFSILINLTNRLHLLCNSKTPKMRYLYDFFSNQAMD